MKHLYQFSPFNLLALNLTNIQILSILFLNVIFLNFDLFSKTLKYDYFSLNVSVIF